ncbi:MAG: MarR family transcriptional regulator [Bacillota bacterium]|nr:MarR family transcriptional regulator [Bacillota bacterium]MDW7683620.1 MarR family transcriptional regulator [Bacillota bacterium]
MHNEKIKEIEQLFLEFFPLYYQKFSAFFRENDKPGFHCTKNQKRAILLIKNKKGLTSTELGQFLDMRKGSLTTLLDSLEEMGLVQRRPDETDRRRALLFLTEAGENYFTEMMARHEKLYQELFSQLSPQETQECLDGLRKVLKAIKKI